MSGFAKEMARMAFKIYDTNHDGFLDITEFIAAKALKGVGEDDAIAEFGLIDDNGDGRLSQAEYVQYMLDDTISDLRKAFVDMDVNGDGHVDREEFVMALVANGKPRKAAMTSCEACFSVADKERVGHITLEQFLAFARSNLDSVMPSNAVIEDVTNDESESAKKHVIARHQATQRSGPRHSKRGRAPPASAQRAAARRSVAPIAEEGGAMEMADQSSSLVDRKASADATEAPSTTDTAMAAAANPSTDTIGEESMEEAYAVTPAQLSNPAAPGAPRASAPEIHPLVRPPPPPSLPPPRTNKMEPPYFKRMREIIDAITAKGATVAQLEDSVADLWELAQAEKSRYAAVLTGVCLAAGIPEKRVDSAVNTWSISSLDDSKHPTPVFGTVKKTIHEEAAAAEAAYLSAICVNEGYGIDRNPKMAAALLKLAGKLGQKDSFFHIAQKHADEGVAAALMASSLKKGSFLAARAIFNVPDNEQIKPALFQKVISRHSPGMTALYKDAERICNAANRQSSRPFLDSDLLESILGCAGSNAKGGGGCCVIA